MTHTSMPLGVPQVNGVKLRLTDTALTEFENRKLRHIEAPIYAALNC
jgi:hypothetical protein